MPFEVEPLAFYGRNVIENDHANLTEARPASGETGQAGSIPHTSSDRLHPSLPNWKKEKVGILGAGIAGLYAALILDSLDIDFEILEASDHTGGRICTYKFPGGGDYDYYDTGAMRFSLPKKDAQGQYKNGIMKRLAKLIEYEPLNKGQDRLKDLLIPYYSRARKGSNPGLKFYNGIHEPISEESGGSFGAQEMGVGADYIRAGVDAIISDVTQPFVRMLVEDMETGKNKGWELLMANDLYSPRAYMATKYLPSAHLRLPPQHLPNEVIHWCGLLGGINIDHALSQEVLAILPHAKIGDTDYGDVEWKCFEGGSTVLPKKIEEYLNKKENPVRLNKRVTAIRQNSVVIDIPINLPNIELPVVTGYSWNDLIPEQEKVVGDSMGDSTVSTPLQRRIRIPTVSITVNGHETQDYTHVISTLPLSVLRTIDLSDACLDIVQRNALHRVEYDSLVKVGILFKSNWWTTKLGIVGGQSNTDLPIRTVVYPSYGVDSSTPSRVLIAAYSWGEDSCRLGALAASSRNPNALRELVLRDLARVHSGLHPDMTYEYLEEEFVDMHVKDWLHDEYAMGGTAFFKPGVFQNFYPSLIYPAARNCLHFAGEGVSAYHGWVVGALDSAWRAIYEYLKITSQDEKVEKFKVLWGDTPEWTSKYP